MVGFSFVAAKQMALNHRLRLMERPNGLSSGRMLFGAGVGVSSLQLIVSFLSCGAVTRSTHAMSSDGNLLLYVLSAWKETRWPAFKKAFDQVYVLSLRASGDAGDLFRQNDALMRPPTAHIGTPGKPTRTIAL
jgi:hypothetical protein